MEIAICYALVGLVCLVVSLRADIHEGVDFNIGELLGYALMAIFAWPLLLIVVISQAKFWKKVVLKGKPQ